MHFDVEQDTPQLWPVLPTRTWLTAWLWSSLPWSLSPSGTLPPAPAPLLQSPPPRVSTCWSTAASLPPAPRCPATASTTATSKTVTVHQLASTGVCLSEATRPSQSAAITIITTRGRLPLKWPRGPGEHPPTCLFSVYVCVCVSVCAWVFGLLLRCSQT